MVKPLLELVLSSRAEKVTQGTVTDFDGNFSLNVKPGAKLKISYIGFSLSQTVIAKNGMQVVLKEEATSLKAVEVVAYGVQKKVTVTGALSSVKSEDLVRTPVGNVNNVLGGQLSGVTTVQYSGEPGSDAASVFVRGKASFNGADPLVQVDGVERSMKRCGSLRKLSSITRFEGCFCHSRIRCAWCQRCYPDYHQAWSGG